MIFSIILFNDTYYIFLSYTFVILIFFNMSRIQMFLDYMKEIID